MGTVGPWGVPREISPLFFLGISMGIPRFFNRTLKWDLEMVPRILITNDMGMILYTKNILLYLINDAWLRISCGQGGY